MWFLCFISLSRFLSSSSSARRLVPEREREREEKPEENSCSLSIFSHSRHPTTIWRQRHPHSKYSSYCFFGTLPRGLMCWFGRSVKHLLLLPPLNQRKSLPTTINMLKLIFYTCERADWGEWVEFIKFICWLCTQFPHPSSLSTANLITLSSLCVVFFTLIHICHPQQSVLSAFVSPPQLVLITMVRWQARCSRVWKRQAGEKKKKKKWNYWKREPLIIIKVEPSCLGCNGETTLEKFHFMSCCVSFHCWENVYRSSSTQPPHQLFAQKKNEMLVRTTFFCV